MQYTIYLKECEEPYCITADWWSEGSYTCFYRDGECVVRIPSFLVERVEPLEGRRGVSQTSVRDIVNVSGGLVYTWIQDPDYGGMYGA